MAGDGARAIVFLHGLGGDLTNWQPQVDHFSDRYRCLSWTLPGYGDSPPLDRLDWAGLSRTLARVMDAASIVQASIVGLSMGGFIAQKFAADHPERVDRLVLAGTTAQFGRGSKRFIEEFLKSRLAPIEHGATPADFAAEVVRGLLSSYASDEATANATSSMNKISPNAYRQALECLVTWDFVSQLPAILAPTLCIAARDDRTAPVAAVQALADGLTSAELFVIENCNHLMNLDQPDEFNRIVERFLDLA